MIYAQAIVQFITNPADYKHQTEKIIKNKRECSKSERRRINMNYIKIQEEILREKGEHIL